MRRLVLPILCGALLALPAGAALGVGSTEDEAAPVIPAADCPEAVAALEEAGAEPVESFSPACPDPDDVVQPELSVLSRDRACQDYESKPAWCPSPDVVAEAEATDSEVVE